MSNVFLYANGRARELTIPQWLDLWARLPLAVSQAVEAGMIVPLGDGVQVWKRG